MNYLLDSNICVHFIRGNQRIISMIDKVGIEHLFISEMTVGELYYGAECSERKEENRRVVDTFLSFISVIPVSGAWKEFAKQKAYLRNKGSMIEDADIIIGATAIVHNMVVVTENIKHIGRLQNIETINWMEQL